MTELNRRNFLAASAATAVSSMVPVPVCGALPACTEVPCVRTGVGTYAAIFPSEVTSMEPVPEGLRVTTRTGNYTIALGTLDMNPENDS